MADVRALYLSGGSVTRLDPTADALLATGIDSSTGALVLGGTNATAVQLGAELDTDTAEALVVGGTNATSIQFGAGLDTDAAEALVIGASNATSVQFGTGIDKDAAEALVIGGSNATSVQFGTGIDKDAAEQLDIGVTNATAVRIQDLLVDAAELDTNGAATLGIGTSNATDITIGQVGVTTTVAGDLQVDGAETVTGTTTFNGDTTIGDSSSDTLIITASVDSDVNFVGPQNLTTSSGDMKLIPEGTTIAQGGLGVALSGTLSVSSGSASVTTSVDLTGELNIGDAIEITSTGGTEVFTVVGVNSTTVTLDSNSSHTDASATGTTDDDLFMATTGDLASRFVIGKTGGASITYGEADGPVLTLSNDQDSIDAQIFVTPDTPPTMSANNGDLALSTGGALYYYNAGWNQVGSATGNNLDEAYDAFTGAATVNVDAKDLTWQISDGAGYDIAWTDGTNDFLRIDDATNSVVLGSSGSNEVTFSGSVNSHILFDGSLRSISNLNAGMQFTTSSFAADAPITISSAGDFNLTASAGAGTDLGTVSVTADDSVTLTSNSGSMTLDSDDGAAGGVINISNGSGNAGFTYGSGGSQLSQAETFVFDNTASTPSSASGGFEVQTAGDMYFQSGLNAVGTATGAIDIIANGDDAGGGDLSLTTSTSNIVLTSQVGTTAGGDIDINADGSTGVTVDSTGGPISLDAAGASNFTVDGANLTLSTSTSGNIIVDSVGDVTVRADDTTTYREVLGLTNNEAAGVGSTDTSASIFVSSNDPNTGEGSGTAANAGDICLTTTGALYINTDGTATGWSQAATGDVSETLQEAYEAGNTINTTAGEGDVTIAGTEALVVTTTGGIDLDTAFDFDGSSFDVQMTGTNGFSVDGTAASNVTVDSANLTLSTTTSGDVVLSSAAGVVQVASGALDVNTSIDFDGTTADFLSSGAISLDAGAASNFTTSSGALTLDGAGGVNIAGNASEVDVTTTGAVDINSGAFTLDGSSAAITTTGDITFTGRSTANPLTYNDATNDNITGTTYISGETSIVGALVGLDSAIASAGDTIVTVNAAEVVSAQDPVAVGDDTTNQGLFITDADTTTYRQHFLGIVKTGASAGNDAEVYTAGIVDVNDVSSGTSPAIGDYVYLSTTQGGLTVDAPTSGTVLRVGILTNATAGSMQMAIQVGTPVTL